MISNSQCLKCEGSTMPLNSIAIGFSLFACFSCMRLYYNSKTTTMTTLDTLKRISAGDWKIGMHPQLTKNQIWEEELERLYEIWISLTMLKE